MAADSGTKSQREHQASSGEQKSGPQQVLTSEPPVVQQGKASHHAHPYASFKDRLLQSVVGPTADRILRSSWPIRALVLLLLTVLPIAWSYKEPLWDVARLASDIPTVIRHPDGVVLSARYREPLSDSINELGKYLTAELAAAAASGQNTSQHDGWEMAQLTVALTGERDVADLFIKNIAAKKSNDNCNCWKENRNSGSPHAATRNWVAVAFAKTHTPLPNEDLEFILNSQHDGFWTQFADAADQKYASTYATAWSVLALKELVDAGLVDQSHRDRVSAAIELGKGWLIAIRKPRTAIWPDYPNAGTQGKEFQGLSAFVLHVLHKLGASTEEMDSAWLEALPSSVPGATDADTNGFPIVLESGANQRDAVRHMKTPWMIMATVDAYSSGSILQRARALHWLDESAHKCSNIRESVMSGNAWAAAELEIGFKYLAGNRLF